MIYLVGYMVKYKWYIRYCFDQQIAETDGNNVNLMIFVMSKISWLSNSNLSHNNIMFQMQCLEIVLFCLYVISLINIDGLSRILWSGCYFWQIIYFTLLSRSGLHKTYLQHMHQYRDLPRSHLVSWKWSLLPIRRLT